MTVKTLPVVAAAGVVLLGLTGCWQAAPPEPPGVTAGPEPAPTVDTETWEPSPPVATTRPTSPSAPQEPAPSRADQITSPGPLPESIREMEGAEAREAERDFRKVEAMTIGVNLLEAAPYSRAGLVAQLQVAGVRPDVAEMAVFEMAGGGTWESQAFLRAQFYMFLSEPDRAELIALLTDEGYTISEAESAADRVGL